MNSVPEKKPVDYQQLALDIKQWSKELGFQQTGITDINLETDEIYTEHTKNYVPFIIVNNRMISANS